MTIVLATNNAHKVLEFKDIFAGHEIVLPKDLGLRFEHDETELTFYRNSLGKAESLKALLVEHKDLWVMADDSGICVEALGGHPGVKSARYGEDLGLSLDDRGRTQLLLRNLGQSTDRRAHFVCSLCLLGPFDQAYVAQEAWQGQIAKIAQGDQGFGYDPIFIPYGYDVSVAQLDSKLKSQISHRARASTVMLKLIEDIKE